MRTRASLRASLVVAAAMAFVTLGACSMALGIDEADYTRGSDASNDAAIVQDTNVSANETEADAPTSTSPCGAAHIFCDDFDRAGSFESHGWSAPMLGAGSTMVADDLDAVSLPRSLSVVGAPDARAELEAIIDSVPARGTLELGFDIRVESYLPGVALGTLRVGSYLVRFLVEGTGAISVDEWDDVARARIVKHSSSLVMSKQWARVKLIVKFVPNRQAGSRIVCAIDGVTVIDVPAAPSVDEGLLRVSIGDVDHPDGSIRARYDNVTFDVTP